MADLSTSTDWALLLAIERLVTDFVYSKEIPIAAELLLKLMANPRTEFRAWRIVLAINYFTDYELNLPESIGAEAFTDPLDLVSIAIAGPPIMPHIIFSRAEQIEVFAFWAATHGRAVFDEYWWQELLSDLTDLQQNQQQRIAILERQELLNNLTQLEALVNNPKEGKLDEFRQLCQATSTLWSQASEFANMLIRWEQGL